MPENDFELYLSLLTRFLRINATQRDAIAEELRDHLEQRLSELEARGLSRDAAIRAALDEFGDAAELANHFAQLARIRKRRMIMRYTFGSAAALAVLVLMTTAFWPETRHAPAPRSIEAQLTPVAKHSDSAAVESASRGRHVARVSNLPATDLANALGTYFAGEQNVQIVAEPVSNSLLISAPPKLLIEAMETLRLLDRPAKSVTMDVSIVELRISTRGDRGVPQSFDAREFEGSAVEIREKLQTLVNDGRVSRIKRFHFQAQENQLSRSEDNEDGSSKTPLSSIVNPPEPALTPPKRSRGESPRQRSGTTISFQARIGGSNLVTAALSIVDSPRPTGSESEAVERSDGIVAGTDSNYNGTVSLVPGHTSVVNSIERDSGSGRSQTLFIISADVIDPNAENAVAANGT